MWSENAVPVWQTRNRCKILWVLCVDSLGSEACLYVCWIWKWNQVSQKVVLDKFHRSSHTSFTVAICDREAEWAPRSGPPEEMEPLSCHKYGIWNSERVHHSCASLLILRLRLTVPVLDRVKTELHNRFLFLWGISSEARELLYSGLLRSE